MTNERPSANRASFEGSALDPQRAQEMTTKVGGFSRDVATEKALLSRERHRAGVRQDVDKLGYAHLMSLGSLI